MKKQNLVIVGISETAERILWFCEHYDLYNIVGFAADKKYIKNSTFHGYPVYELENLDNYIDKENDVIFVAIFWNHLNADRRLLFERLKKEGWHFANIVSPKASVRGEIGENVWIMDFVIIQEGAIVQDNVFIADNALIGNGALIKNHSFCAARSTIMGTVSLGEQTFVGVNATIFDNTQIGEKCIIGACTIVKRNVPAFTVVKTDTSNYVIKQYPPEIMETKLVTTKNVR